jgi:hypothetical protein
MLILGSTSFEVNNDTRGTAFFVHKDENGNLTISFSLTCQDNQYNELYCSPSMIINDFETGAKQLQELIGKSFSVNDIETSDGREDLFYLFEHEPFVEYSLTIIDIDGNKIRIKCSGIAVTDGYAEPYETSPFEMDCWLPIITNVSDWKKFGL